MNNNLNIKRLRKSKEQFVACYPANSHPFNIWTKKFPQYVINGKLDLLLMEDEILKRDKARIETMEYMADKNPSDIANLLGRDRLKTSSARLFMNRMFRVQAQLLLADDDYKLCLEIIEKANRIQYKKEEGLIWK